ncbi:3',5'-cyclic AMP phosphodiesterase CpdA [Bacillus pakistanensis]|uniref:3',5'-cyclic AMP phosphodiesterase CpdA n=1 Tax=Rossellomorea pakistanensis TaxID=992288 RepID=A0ABS2NJK3_9BACI|nr:metallophosphoesterase [Bacillus pakistanensis]MBM7588039.1 3',5'-cyclic AMP phosphodiesterase CpdA [Bacillus pakistanensis]
MKKRTRMGAILVALSIGFTTSFTNVQAFSEESNIEKHNRKPELVFPVISDVHIDNSSDADVKKFQSAMDQLNKVAPEQDAFVVVGDLTDYGYKSEYERFFSIYDESKKDEAESMFTMGNHDYWNGLSVSAAQDRFLEETGMESIYYHKEVGGYHFISLSPESGTTHGLYSVDQIKWLGEQLKAAEKDNPGEPIFVFLHQHIKDTVYGSHLWGTEENKELLYDTLKNYPQVITFSGHSHYPLEDPRTIHQKDFTSIGTSSVSYLELEPGKLQGAHPPKNGNISQGLVVEVYKNKVVVKRRDFHKDDWAGEPWVIKHPAKSKKFKYTEDRDDKNPTFRKKDRATIVENQTTLNSLTVEFPQAKDNLLVHSYEINAKDLETGQVEKSVTAFSEFYYDPMPKTLRFPISGLQPGKTYEVEVIAKDSFGNSSKRTLIGKGTTKALEMVSAQATPSFLQNGDSTMLNIALKNHGKKETEGKVIVDAPEGWVLSKEEIPYTLAGGEETTLSVNATPSEELNGESPINVKVYEKETLVDAKTVQVLVNMTFGENFNPLQSLLKPATDENIPSSILGYTHTAPNGWTVTNSTDMPIGTTEWQGWSFTTKEFWTSADGQNRGDFSLGEGVIAVADPDEWDDKNSPASKGFFDSTLTSPAISIEGKSEMFIGFASHYKQEGIQKAEVTATFNTGDEKRVLLYSNDNSSDNSGQHTLNKYETRAIQVPKGATTMQLHWRMFDAKNNWYWAIDDIRLDDQAIKAPN